MRAKDYPLDPNRALVLEAIVICEGDCSGYWKIKSACILFLALYPVTFFVLADTRDYTTCIGNDARTTREFFFFLLLTNKHHSPSLVKN